MTDRITLRAYSLRIHENEYKNQSIISHPKPPQTNSTKTKPPSPKKKNLKFGPSIHQMCSGTCQS